MRQSVSFWEEVRIDQAGCPDVLPKLTTCKAPLHLRLAVNAPLGFVRIPYLCLEASHVREALEGLGSEYKRLREIGVN